MKMKVRMISKDNWIILDMLVDKMRYMLVNIYVPNIDDATFFQDIHLRIQSFEITR